MKQAMVDAGFPSDSIMVIAGLSNTYSDYVTTFEEYQVCVCVCVYVCVCVCVCVCVKFNIDERRWYQLAQDRSGWRRSCRTGLQDVAEARVAEDERRRRTSVEDSIENSGSSTVTDKPYQCSVCERAFR